MRGVGEGEDVVELAPVDLSFFHVVIMACSGGGVRYDVQRRLAMVRPGVRGFSGDKTCSGV